MPDVQNSSLARLLQSTGEGVLRLKDADVGRTREALRRTRWRRLVLGFGLASSLVVLRDTYKGSEAFLPFPHVDPTTFAIFGFLGGLLLLMAIQMAVTGRSPHIVYRPEQLDARLSDVVGIDPVKEEVIRSLNLFLARDAFQDGMGGTPRRGLLFEGPPGTGKTHMARAMAAEAGVPFLFASGTSFTSPMQGASAKKIRSFFKDLRKAARKEGGAIGFIEEIDAIAMSRSGVSTAATPLAVAGCSGMTSMPAVTSAMTTHAFTGPGDAGSMINELLVQMQSFEEPVGWQRPQGWIVDKLNLLLPEERQLKRPTPPRPNVLIIAATNRASSLDPALLRPGRFDRKLSFELPAKNGRRQLVDHFLAKKAHAPELDSEERRDALAAITTGYSPVMIENLCDEALVNAVRRGDTAMTWEDLEKARLSTEVGIGQPVEYTDHERVLIATHEAGHATLAWLTAPHRRLEILTIIKRKGSLGLLAHGDREDVYTRSRSEMEALIQIAFGGQCAEEIFFGDVSTGPGGDLLYATNTAAEMVGAHGMDSTLISFLAVQGSALTDTNIVGRVLSDEQGRAAVEDLLVRQKAKAKALLSANTHLVEALRDALLEHEELIGSEITDVLEKATKRRTIDLRDPKRVRKA